MDKAVIRKADMKDRRRPEDFATGLFVEIVT
jgi:hypothetical protein